jgi:hypothetical protein
LGIDPKYLAADDLRHTVESSRRELQLCFRPHFDPRSAHKVMGLQSPGSPAGRDFGTPARESRESQERKAIWMWVPWRVTEYTIRGKVVASPKSGPWWVLCVRVARDWSQHQRCSNYALTTLCGLCAGSCEWINLSILPSPILELQHALLPLKVLWARERISTPPSSTVFHLDSHLSPARSWECVNLGLQLQTWEFTWECEGSFPHTLCTPRSMWSDYWVSLLARHLPTPLLWSWAQG